MPLDERNVPVPPDNDGCRGDSPVTSHSLRVGYISRSAISCRVPARKGDDAPANPTRLRAAT